MLPGYYNAQGYYIKPRSECCKSSLVYFDDETKQYLFIPFHHEEIPLHINFRCYNCNREIIRFNLSDSRVETMQSCSTCKWCYIPVVCGYCEWANQSGQSPECMKDYRCVIDNPDKYGKNCKVYKEKIVLEQKLIE